VGCRGNLLSSHGPAMSGTYLTISAVQAELSDGRRTGVVRKWLDNRGVGWILQDGSGEEVFAHFSEIEKGWHAKGSFQALQPGEKVEYRLIPNPRNPAQRRAGDITGPGGAPVLRSEYSGREKQNPSDDEVSGAEQKPLSPPVHGRALGTVEKWLNLKGIGWILPDAGGDMILVHFSEIIGQGADGFRSLREGERVEFGFKEDPQDPTKKIACKVQCQANLIEIMPMSGSHSW